MSYYPDLRKIAATLEPERVARAASTHRTIKRCAGPGLSGAAQAIERNAKVRKWLILHGPATITELCANVGLSSMSVRKALLVVAEFDSWSSVAKFRPARLWRAKA